MYVLIQKIKQITEKITSFFCFSFCSFSFHHIHKNRSHKKRLWSRKWYISRSPCKSPVVESRSRAEDARIGPWTASCRVVVRYAILIAFHWSSQMLVVRLIRYSRASSPFVPYAMKNSEGCASTWNWKEKNSSSIEGPVVKVLPRKRSMSGPSRAAVFT